MNQAVIFSEHDLPWVPLAPGIEWQIYHADETAGCWTVRIHLHPGSVLPQHRHVGPSEFYVIEGEGNHPQSGDFKAGDYGYEPDGSVHTPVHAQKDIYLYMAMYGKGEFTNADGSVAYVADAAYLSKQMGNGVFDVLARKIKYFVLIYMWKKVKGRG